MFLESKELLKLWRPASGGWPCTSSTQALTPGWRCGTRPWRVRNGGWRWASSKVWRLFHSFSLLKVSKTWWNKALNDALLKALNVSRRPPALANFGRLLLQSGDEGMWNRTALARCARDPRGAKKFWKKLQKSFKASNTYLLTSLLTYLLRSK